MRSQTHSTPFFNSLACRKKACELASVTRSIVSAVYQRLAYSHALLHSLISISMRAQVYSHQKILVLLVETSTCIKIYETFSWDHVQWALTQNLTGNSKEITKWKRGSKWNGCIKNQEKRMGNSCTVMRHSSETAIEKPSFQMLPILSFECIISCFNIDSDNISASTY